MQIEIETRFKLTNASKLRKLLRARGAVAESQTRQIDTYFNSPHRDFLQHDIITEWLRVRNEDGRASITFKKWQEAASGCIPFCHELEAAVSDDRVLSDLLQALGFVRLVTVDKLREVWRISSGIRVCIDSVATLGSFVEFESLTKPVSGKPLTKQIESITRAYRSCLGDPDRRGYPYHLLGRNS